jgi:hypothetical protein
LFNEQMNQSAGDAINTYNLNGRSGISRETGLVCNPFPCRPIYSPNEKNFCQFL